MSQRYDVVVVGGGVAGATASVLLARADRRVLLLERRERGRLGEKVCGCCLHRRGVAALTRLGLMPAGGTPLRSVWLSRVDRRGQRRVRLPLRQGVVLRRSVLDGHLLDAAEAAGVVVRDGVRAWVADGMVEVGGVSIEAERVVLATGLGGARPVRGALLHGVGTVLPASLDGVTSMPVGTVWLMSDARTRSVGGGYLGLVRLPGGGLDLAAAVTTGVAREPASWASRLLAAAGEVRLAAAAGAAPWRSVGPLRRAAAPDASGTSVRAGDAAGYAEPLTGEGMAWAVQSAEKVVAAVLADDAHRPRRWRGWADRLSWSRRRCHLTSAAAQVLPAVAGRRVSGPRGNVELLPGGGAACGS